MLKACFFMSVALKKPYMLAGSNGSDDEPPPPKPARPVYPMSPTGSIPNLSFNSSASSTLNHWNSTSQLPLGHSTPAGPSPSTDILKHPGSWSGLDEHGQPRLPPTNTTNVFKGYFPSATGYMQVSLLMNVARCCMVI